MKVRELIELLGKFDPELPAVSIVGDCDEVYEAGEPDIIFIDQGDDPGIWSRKPTDHCSVKAVVV